MSGKINRSSFLTAKAKLMSRSLNWNRPYHKDRGKVPTANKVQRPPTTPPPDRHELSDKEIMAMVLKLFSK